MKNNNDKRKCADIGVGTSAVYSSASAGANMGAETVSADVDVGTSVVYTTTGDGAGADIGAGACASTLLLSSESDGFLDNTNADNLDSAYIIVASVVIIDVHVNHQQHYCYDMHLITRKQL